MRVRKTSGNEDRRCSNPEVGKSVKGGPTPTTEATETCFRAKEANKPTKEQKRPTKEQQRPASEQRRQTNLLRSKRDLPRSNRDLLQSKQGKQTY